MPLAALIFSTTACAKTVEEPVIEPQPVCPLPTWVEPPVLTAKACGNDVCLPWSQARDLGLWIGAARRWHDMAEICLNLGHFQRPTPLFIKPESAEDRAAKIRASGVNQIVVGMTLKGMDVKVEWRQCGEVNGFYEFDEHTLVMCYELLELSPGFVRFVAAHEMSHAIIMQLDIPYTGLHEMAADELGAVVLHVLDRQADILDAAEYFHKLGRPEAPWDPHPGDLRRWVLLTLLAGENGYFDHAVSTWARLLAGHRY